MCSLPPLSSPSLTSSLPPPPSSAFTRRRASRNFSGCWMRRLRRWGGVFNVKRDGVNMRVWTLSLWKRVQQSWGGGTGLLFLFSLSSSSDWSNWQLRDLFQFLQVLQMKPGYHKWRPNFKLNLKWNDFCFPQYSLQLLSLSSCFCWLTG